MSGCGPCKGCPPASASTIKDADYTLALAGNANVGKSVIFNQLTGVDQIIGNWPGKTVERAEGLLVHGGKRYRVIDLPGIYSFSTYSMEELVSRDFIALEHPDAVINVV
ncbi:MAG: FeoB small GTPase domain-containing protein, partial [Methanoregula sp.]|nr:FeoB small GTPase domain-containing protein [Methanoregula sp.]